MTMKTLTLLALAAALCTAWLSQEEPTYWTLVTGLVVLTLFYWWRGQKSRTKKTGHLPAGIIQPLDFIQQMMVYSGEKGNLLLSNVLILDTKEPVPSDLIRKTGYHLMKKHPLLQARVHSHGEDNPVFVRMSDIDEDSVRMRVVDSADWIGAAEEELLEKYDCSSGPLWRTRYLPSVHYEGGPSGEFTHQCAVVFAFHHAIIDGQAYVWLFKDFIDILDLLLSKEMVLDEEMPIYGSITNYVNKPSIFRMMLTNISIYILTSRLVLFLLRSPRFIHPYIKKNGATEFLEPNILKKTRMIPVEFTKVETTQFLQKCKQNGCTVQGAVQAGCGVAAARYLTDDPTEEVTVSTSCTANMRPFLDGHPVPPNALGVFLGGFQSVPKYKPSISGSEEFWNLARRETKTLKMSIEKKRHIATAQFAHLSNRFLPVISKLVFRNIEGNANRANVCVTFTNLGHCPFLVSRSSHLELQARYGCSAEHNQGGIFTNNIITFGGKMYWTFVSYTNIISHERAKDFADAVKGILMSVTLEKIDVDQRRL